MQFVKILTTLILTCSLASVANAASTEQSTKDMPPVKHENTEKQPTPSYGQLLYDNHCIACHTSVVHVRDKQRATNRDMLRSWVVKWSDHQKLEWSEIEVRAITDYLAQRYYKFDKRQ